MSKKKILIWLGGLLGAVGIFLVIGSGWLVLAHQPLSNPLTKWLPWPVACSTRGCITTWDWQRQTTAARVFAAQTTEAITANDTLATLIRQHLVHYAFVQSPISVSDAKRYREEILKISSEELVKEKTGLSLVDYDRLVIMPLLEQESLRQQRKAETLDELFVQLAQERWVVVFPWHMRWDKNSAKVMER